MVFLNNRQNKLNFTQPDKLTLSSHKKLIFI
jgi:hypothetical protein